MKDHPTPDEIYAWPYVKLLAMLGESNLPPGGLDTIRRLAINCHLRPGMNALHTGCNAGFLSREIARRSGCNVTGIDISPDMVEAAQRRAAEEDLTALVTHQEQDMRAMSFEGKMFDVVFSGGALAFVDGHRKAIEEWIRVVRPYGLLADAEFFYHTEPPKTLLDQVSRIIEVEVPHYSPEYWPSVFKHKLLQPYHRYEENAISHSEEEVELYCDRMLAFVAPSWSPSAQRALRERWLNTISVFNENMKYLGYSFLVYRRVTEKDEPQLFI